MVFTTQSVPAEQAAKTEEVLPAEQAAKAEDKADLSEDLLEEEYEEESLVGASSQNLMDYITYSALRRDRSTAISGR